MYLHKECVKDRREWRRIVGEGTTMMIQGEAGCMKQLKLWMFLICFALGFDSFEGKKSVVWVEPMLCVGWPQILEKRPYCWQKKNFPLIGGLPISGPQAYMPLYSRPRADSCSWGQPAYNMRVLSQVDILISGAYASPHHSGSCVSSHSTLHGHEACPVGLNV